MNNIEELFVLYEESLALKELGFDEPCFGFYKSSEDIIPTTELITRISLIKNLNNRGMRVEVLAPLYQQAFKFFRDNYKLESEFKKLEEGYTFHCFKNQEELVKSISKLFDDDRKKYVYQTYEKAELECLKQLIKIVKNEK